MWELNELKYVKHMEQWLAPSNHYTSTCYLSVFLKYMLNSQQWKVLSDK